MKIISFVILNILVVNCAFAQYRGDDILVEKEAPAVNKMSSLKTGRNIALVIGTDTYKAWKPLSNPVLDATTIAGVLKTKYNYETSLLINPPKDTIIKRLRDLNDDFARNKYGANTNLFIFIAGHGSYDNFSKGYLVPADAKDPKADISKSTYIEYTSIKDKINELNATHILLALDVCNGGTFDALMINNNKDASPCKTISDSQFDKLFLSEFLASSSNCKSRKFIASGGNESVADGRPGEHSPFAKEIIRFLNKNHDNKRVTGFQHLCYDIADISTSTAVFSDFSGTSAGADYLFVPTSIKQDVTLSNCYKSPPTVTGYTTKAPTTAGKIIIIPKQKNYEPISNSMNDEVLSAAITKISEAFMDKGINPVYYDFSTAANVNDDKPQILKKSGADIYIEVDVRASDDGTGANGIAVILTCVKTAGNSIVYKKTYQSGYFRTNDYSALATRALRDNTDEIVKLTIK